MKKVKAAIYGCSAAGMLIVWGSLHSGTLSALSWNLAPYLLVLLLTVIVKDRVITLFGVVIMLLVDASFYLGVALGVDSPLMVPGSLLVTLKVFIVLPIGLTVGFLIRKRYTKRGRT